MSQRVRDQPGTIRALRLENGEHTLVQVIARSEKGALSTCALFGRRYASVLEATAALPRLAPADVVATIIVPTKNLSSHDGPEWPVLGVFPVINKTVAPAFRLSAMERVRQALGLLEVHSRFSTIGVLYSLAHACAGLRPWDEMAEPDYYEQYLLDAKHPLVVRRVSARS